MNPLTMPKGSTPAEMRASAERLLRNPRYWAGMGKLGAEYYITVRDTMDSVIRAKALNEVAG